MAARSRYKLRRKMILMLLNMTEEGLTVREIADTLFFPLRIGPDEVRQSLYYLKRKGIVKKVDKVWQINLIES